MPTMNNNTTKPIELQLASLNANSLIKTNNSHTQTNCIGHLRGEKFTILCLQESHADNEQKIRSLNILFQSKQSHWTPHPLTQTFNSLYSSDRYQLCQVKHPQNFYEPFHILNLYAPASSASARKNLSSRLASMLDTLQDDQTISMDSLIICGDFNYSLLRPRQYKSSTTDNWRILLETQFYNSMEANQMNKVPTFQRTRHAETSVWSVIDYIYLGQSFIHYLVRNDITRLDPNWSDHNVLQITLQLSSSPIGPEMWRANPAYASHKKLRRQLSLRLTQLVNDLTTSNLSDDYLWDSVKLEAKSIIRKYGVKYVGWRQERIKFLGKTRNRLLRSITDPIIRHKMVSPIDQELGDLQEEIAEIASVKAG